MSKTVKHDYDLLVIGAGAAGSSAATTVDKEGKRVGLVECSMLGGTCLNYGCDPTKTLLHIANLLYQARHAKRFGLRIPEATFEWADVLAWVQQVVTRLRDGTPEEARAGLARQGIELADVTVLERSPTMLDKEDRELADRLCTLLTREGMHLEANAELKRAQREGKGKRLAIRCGEREEELIVDEILMAVGRRASFEALHLGPGGKHHTF